MRKNFPSCKGFTLIELLFTMLISAIVIGGVFMSLISTLVLNEYTQGFSVAMNIARAQMEQVLANRGNFTGIVTSPVNPDSTLFTPGSSPAGWRLTQANNGINGLLGMEVTDLGDLKHVRIVVCWRGRAGKITGDCRESSGVLYWNTYNSPCTLETDISRIKN